MESVTVRMSRGDENTPWGFRLQGGQEYNQPLVISMVVEGSLADRAGLKQGDQLNELLSRNARGIKHEDAQGLILSSRTDLDLKVSRTGSGTTQIWKPSYTNVVGGSLNEQQKQTQSSVVTTTRTSSNVDGHKTVTSATSTSTTGGGAGGLSPGGGGAPPPLPSNPPPSTPASSVPVDRPIKVSLTQNSSFSDNRANLQGYNITARPFAGPGNYGGQPRHVNAPSGGGGGGGGGLSPRHAPQQHYAPPQQQQPSPRQQQHYAPPPPQQQQQQPSPRQQPSQPSPRAAPAPQPAPAPQASQASPKVQQSGFYHQPSQPDQMYNPKRGGGQVFHAQFNDPIGLYSKKNAADAYLQQTGGLFGTDPALVKPKIEPQFMNSATLRLIQETEGLNVGRDKSPATHGRGPPPPAIHTYQDPYAKGRDETLHHSEGHVQSGSFKRLTSSLAHEDGSLQQTPVMQHQYHQPPQPIIPQQDNQPSGGGLIGPEEGGRGGGAPSGGPDCDSCGREISGVFCKAGDRALHPECFKCTTCGTNLKNGGYFLVANKIYCEIHAKQRSTGYAEPAPRPPVDASTFAYAPEILKRTQQQQQQDHHQQQSSGRGGALSWRSSAVGGGSQWTGTNSHIINPHDRGVPSKFKMYSSVQEAAANDYANESRSSTTVTRTSTFNTSAGGYAPVSAPFSPSAPAPAPAPISAPAPAPASAPAPLPSAPAPQKHVPAPFTDPANAPSASSVLARNGFTESAGEKWSEKMESQEDGGDTGGGIVDTSSIPLVESVENTICTAEDYLIALRERLEPQNAESTAQAVQNLLNKQPYQPTWHRTLVSSAEASESAAAARLNRRSSFNWPPQKLSPISGRSQSYRIPAGVFSQDSSEPGPLRGPEDSDYLELIRYKKSQFAHPKSLSGHPEPMRDELRRSASMGRAQDIPGKLFKEDPDRRHVVNQLTFQNPSRVRPQRVTFDHQPKAKKRVRINEDNTAGSNVSTTISETSVHARTTTLESDFTTAVPTLAVIPGGSSINVPPASTSVTAEEIVAGENGSSTSSVINNRSEVAFEAVVDHPSELIPVSETNYVVAAASDLVDEVCHSAKKDLLAVDRTEMEQKFLSPGTARLRSEGFANNDVVDATIEGLIDIAGDIPPPKPHIPLLPSIKSSQQSSLSSENTTVILKSDPPQLSTSSTPVPPMSSTTPIPPSAQSTGASTSLYHADPSTSSTVISHDQSFYQFGNTSVRKTRQSARSQKITDFSEIRRQEFLTGFDPFKFDRELPRLPSQEDDFGSLGSSADPSSHQEKIGGSSQQKDQPQDEAAPSAPSGPGGSTSGDINLDPDVANLFKQSFGLSQTTTTQESMNTSRKSETTTLSGISQESTMQPTSKATQLIRKQLESILPNSIPASKLHHVQEIYGGLLAKGFDGNAPSGNNRQPRRGKGVLKQLGELPRIPICETCHREIRGPFILAMSKTWCPEHFACANAQCQRKLVDVGFVEEEGCIYCEYCFEQYLAPICAKCGRPIIGDCLNAIDRQWHPDCFTCTTCGKPFGNATFFLEDGKPYCENDWNEMFTTKCVSCQFPIEAGDRWVEALDHAYHSNCFTCSSCQTNLEGQSFYAKGGRPYCKVHA